MEQKITAKLSAMSLRHVGYTVTVGIQQQAYVSLLYYDELTLVENLRHTP